MIHFVVFSECIKIFTPYVRKYILIALDPEECLLLNAIIVMLLCGLYFFYKMWNSNHKIENTFRKYKSMSPMQILFACWVGLATVISSMVVLTMDKHYNTPLINNILFKVISVMLLLLTGVIFFKESYNYNQILGIMLIVLGVVLLFYHSENGMSILSKARD